MQRSEKRKPQTRREKAKGQKKEEGAQRSLEHHISQGRHILRGRALTIRMRTTGLRRKEGKERHRRHST